MDKIERFHIQINKNKESFLALDEKITRLQKDYIFAGDAAIKFTLE